MSIGHRSYDDAITTSPADRELGNVGDRTPRATHVPQVRCMACGGLAYRGQLCSECYLEGRTCGLKGELDHE